MAASTITESELHERVVALYERIKYWQSGPEALAACYEQVARELEDRRIDRSKTPISDDG